MRNRAIAAAATLLGLVIMVFIAPQADAKKSGPTGRSSSRVVHAPHAVHRPVTVRHGREGAHKVRHELHAKKVQHEPHPKHALSGKNDKALSVKDRKFLQALPITKAVAGNQLLKGRLAVPQNLHPKLTLTHAPAPKFKKGFAPFVQRYWKKPFFWVVIAGIGYLTVPEFVYDDFYGCIGVDDPFYDDCVYILAYAALEEEEVVRVSMPPAAAYRYRLTAAAAEDCPACRWDPFVERKWNQSYGWVKIPRVGNVTVPDAHYDRFREYAGANPPDLPHACLVLQDAASAQGEGDVVRITMPPGAEYRYEVAEVPARHCASCSLAPFVERKWNRAYVWAQVPDTGNVTVPEDVYDRFLVQASADPPNYAAACRLLTEAAAADTVMTSSLDTRGPE